MKVIFKDQVTVTNFQVKIYGNGKHKWKRNYRGLALIIDNIIPYVAFIPTGAADYNTLFSEEIDMADFKLNGKPWSGKEFKLDWTVDHFHVFLKFITVHYSVTPVATSPASYLTNADQIGVKLLTYMDETELRKIIKERAQKLLKSQITEAEKLDLKRNILFYVKKTKEKLDFYKLDDIEYTEPLYSYTEWDAEIKNLEHKMKYLESCVPSNFARLHLDSDSFFVNLAHVIPQSMAEQRFSLLHLDSMITNMFDVLSMKVTNGGFTFGFTLIAGISTRKLLEGTQLEVQTGWQGLKPVRFDITKYYTQNITKKTYERILRVLVGIFSFDTSKGPEHLSGIDEFLKNFEQNAKLTIAFLRLEFSHDKDLIKDWIIDFNKNNQNNSNGRAERAENIGRRKYFDESWAANVGTQEAQIKQQPEIMKTLSNQFYGNIEDITTKTTS